MGDGPSSISPTLDTGCSQQSSNSDSALGLKIGLKKWCYLQAVRKTNKFTISVARSTQQEELLSESKPISRYSFIKTKVFYMEVKKMMAGKQNPRDFHENGIPILQHGYFLLKDAERVNPK